MECELNKGDPANGSAASTSNQAGDMSVVITAGVRTPFSALCDLPQRVKSERKRKKASLLLSYKCRAHAVHHTTKEDKKGEDSDDWQ